MFSKTGRLLEPQPTLLRPPLSLDETDRAARDDLDGWIRIALVAAAPDRPNHTGRRRCRVAADVRAQHADARWGNEGEAPFKATALQLDVHLAPRFHVNELGLLGGRRCDGGWRVLVGVGER